MEGCEECTHSPKGEEFSLPGAVVYSRELLEKRVRVAQPSAGFALLTAGITKDTDVQNPGISIMIHMFSAEHEDLKFVCLCKY